MLVCMELRHLRYFLAVADSGGFGAAARLLHVSQSAISEQIADLEEEVAVPLLDRSKRATQLTPAGEVFVRCSRDIVRMAAQAVEDTRGAYRGETGRLTIGFFAGGTDPKFAQLIRQFRSTHPSVSVSLVEMTPTAQHTALLSGAIDVGFTRPIPLALRSDLHGERLYTEHFVVVLPKGHALAKEQSIPVKTLHTQRFVMNDRMNSPAVFDKVISMCADAGFSPNIAAQASVSAGVIAMVEAGAGIGVLPWGSQMLGSKGVVFVPVADRGASIDLMVVWSPSRTQGALRAFVDLVRTSVRKNGK